jgi:mRNA-degrading endonuclease RelE of RelBE toxin-antitoxin system
MKRFEVVFSPSAARDLAVLEAEDSLQLLRDIKAYLETSPLPFGKSRIKRLRSFTPPLYRLRSGNWRAYYRLLSVSDRVVVLAITHRRDSERVLKRLRQRG